MPDLWTLSPRESKYWLPDSEGWRVDYWARCLAAHDSAQMSFSEWVSVVHPSHLPMLHEAARSKFGTQDYADEWYVTSQYSLWRGAQFAHANFEGAKTGMARIEDVKFQSMKFMDWAWDTCEVRNIVMENGSFVGCKIWTSNVSHSVFDCVRMRGLDLFRNTHEDVTFTSCDFDEADFSECKFEGVRFSGCANRESLWREDVLQDCLFVECDFTETEFRRCDFQNVTFIRCNFADAKLQKGSFRGCKFINCCNFSGNTLKLAEESGAVFIACVTYWEK